jgi:hypothetical protein
MFQTIKSVRNSTHQFPGKYKNCFLDLNFFTLSNICIFNWIYLESDELCTCITKYAIIKRTIKVTFQLLSILLLDGEMHHSNIIFLISKSNLQRKSKFGLQNKVFIAAVNFYKNKKVKCSYRIDFLRLKYTLDFHLPQYPYSRGTTKFTSKCLRFCKA